MADQAPPTPLAKRELSELERLAIMGKLDQPVAKKEDSKLLVRDFAHALSSDGIALISGVFGVALAFLAAYYAFIAQHNIAVLWLLAFLSIAVASYRVWVKERRVYLAERDKNANPEIKGEIVEVHDEWAVPPSRKNEQGKEDTTLEHFFTIKARIFNVRPVPTTVRFELWLQAPHANCKANRSSLTGLFLRREEHATGIISRTSMMQLVTEPLTDLDSLGRTPLARGEEREGWIRFVLPKGNNPARSDIQAICLVVKDIYGGTHFISSPRSEWTHSGEIITQFVLDLEEQKLKDLRDSNLL